MPKTLYLCSTIMLHVPQRHLPQPISLMCKEHDLTLTCHSHKTMNLLSNFSNKNWGNTSQHRQVSTAPLVVTAKYLRLCYGNSQRNTEIRPFISKPSLNLPCNN